MSARQLGVIVIFTILICWGVLPLGSFGADRIQTPAWPGFLGPTQQGHAESNAKPPIEISETSHLTWKKPISGSGYSSPVIADRQIWITSARLEEHQLCATCYDLETGDILFDVVVFEPEEWEEIHNQNSHASPSPVIDQKFVYVNYGSNGTAAIDRQTGEVVWRNTELKVDFLTGAGSSPMVYHDTIILNMDGADQQYCVALNKDDGSIRWKTARSQPFRDKEETKRCFNTPLILYADGKQIKEDLVISLGADQLHAYNPIDGSEVWHITYIGFSTVPHAICDGEFLYFCTGFPKSKLMAVKLGGHGKVTDTNVAWVHERGASSIPSPLLIDDLIYMPTEKGIFFCIDPNNGEIVYQERLGGKFSGSPVYANGLIYTTTEEGKMLVIKPGKEFEIVHETTLDGGMIHATPAIVGNTIIQRTEKFLYRFD